MHVSCGSRRLKVSRSLQDPSFAELNGGSRSSSANAFAKCIWKIWTDVDQKSLTYATYAREPNRHYLTFGSPAHSSSPGPLFTMAIRRCFFGTFCSCLFIFRLVAFLRSVCSDGRCAYSTKKNIANKSTHHMRHTATHRSAFSSCPCTPWMDHAGEVMAGDGERRIAREIVNAKCKCDL